MIRLTDQPIETSPLIAQASRPEAGAVLLFLGITREWTDDRQTVTLDYEAYGPMAEQKLAELESEARQRWPLVECLIVHRVGTVSVSEASVAVVVSSAHRHDAFAAGQWLIDTLKECAPIWKREQYADGTTEWVHPGIESAKSLGDKETTEALKR